MSNQRERAALFYIFFGPDDFSLREALKELKEGLGNEESLAINTTLFDAQQLSPNQLINVCNAVPFLGQYRLVIVEGLLGRFEQKGQPRGSGFSAEDGWQSLSDYIEQMPATTVLVLVDGKVARDNPLLKKLASKAVVKAFPPLRGANLHRWIQSRVSKAKGHMSPSAVKSLAELAGESLWILASEIEKLLLYTAGRRIEQEDVQRVVGYAREANVFSMVDAILEHRASEAMQQLHQLLQEGAIPAYLLVMITRQVRLIVQAKELSFQELQPEEIQARLGLPPNYPVNKLIRQTASYSRERLFKVYHKLLETDIAIKTGKWKDELALDLLVAELCHLS